MTGNAISQISVEELAQRLSAQDSSIQLVDVREPQELAIASIEGFVNFPLSEFAEWGDQIPTLLNPHAETLVLCHHGMRSLMRKLLYSAITVCVLLRCANGYLRKALQMLRIFRVELMLTPS